MLALVIGVLVLLAASALTSGTEAALFSVPLVKAKQLAEQGTPSGRALLWIQENMTRPIAAIVVLNNVANIVGSIVVGVIATVVLGSRWLGVFSAVLTSLVIIFAEIIPKTFGERNAERISLIMARPVIAITRLLTPILWSIEKITLPFTKGPPRFTTNEAEIRLLAHIGYREGALERIESELIPRVFELDKTTAAEMMTPRVAMTYLEGDLALADAQNRIIESEHSRIIVVRDAPDDLIGVALKDDLLTALVEDKGSMPVSAFVREVQFVPETTRADRLLSVFRQTRQHLAVVLDEFGGVSGVVTLEDVLEVLTGEIVDETDKTVDLQLDARQRVGGPEDD